MGIASLDPAVPADSEAYGRGAERIRNVAAAIQASLPAFTAGQDVCTLSGTQLSNATTKNEAQTITAGWNFTAALQKSGVSVATTSDLAAYEPAITKNTAFNKNYGGNGSADTIARSDHTHGNTFNAAYAFHSWSGNAGQLQITTTSVADAIQFTKQAPTNRSGFANLATITPVTTGIYEIVWSLSGRHTSGSSPGFYVALSPYSAPAALAGTIMQGHYGTSQTDVSLSGSAIVSLTAGTAYILIAWNWYAGQTYDLLSYAITTKRIA
jgi:hypothetical protein